jgi:cobalt-zinc-cadmium efflux system membrane fusion protein
MTSRSTIAVDHEQADTHSVSDVERPSRRPAPRKGSGLLKFFVFILILAGVGGVIYASVGKEKVLEGLTYLKEQVAGSTKHAAPPSEAPPPPSRTLLNGMVRVTEKERQAIGFKVIPVAPQTEPIRLELNGTTDYNLNTLTKIRPRFDNALVTKVYVSAGQSVKKGDPLLELRSADLAAAKNDCRTKFVQHDHDYKYLVAREPLAKEGRITQIIWTDTQNDEKKSRLDYFVARDKLKTYGMNNEQIDHLLEGLSDDRAKALQVNNNTEDLANMTVHSPIDGIVVERDVVPDNFYDMVNIMLTISPMTELWVWGNVFESDQEKVHIGQKWDIVFQFSKESIPAHVESIANGVDPETRTLRIRASIPNPGNRLKARMLVRAILQIAPLPGDTVIPRNALSVINGEYYAFVQKGDSGEDADLFERRRLEIEQENSDLVIVKKGLEVGDKVVSNGALILSQIFEDKSTVDSGLPLQ